MLDAETLKRLETRQAQLAEILVAETDSKTWPDANTRDGRGDRYWHKKNAGATATLMVKIQSILDQALKKPVVGDPKEPPPGADPEEANPQELAAAAVREAQEIVDRHRGRFSKGKK